MFLKYQTIKRRYSKKKFWVAPLFKNRDKYGFYKATLPYLRLKDARFFNYFRMSSTQLEELLQIVRPKLHKQTFLREPISVEERLCLTLRYLASGDSMVSISYQYLIGRCKAYFAAFALQGRTTRQPKFVHHVRVTGVRADRYESTVPRKDESLDKSFNEDLLLQDGTLTFIGIFSTTRNTFSEKPRTP
ncbi:hypothetical protein ALC57_06524 [Trachymyrmex cornetzi]|uniref:DDE Tnp4 domain-containing protein n=1 Tax=Trachymyrmex cornetzi TaxID=471704 RepID=A0A151J8E6_9HYME|nr:hypothetical protein ALC57_06524 [Trachymyrmex cornetzi]